MAFPSSLDSFTDVSPNGLIRSTTTNQLHAAVRALEAKVGVDNSAVTSSLDYRIKAGAPMIDVRDFGAVGDGTDNTARIQAAIDSLDDNPGIVFIPKAQPSQFYGLSAPLVLESGQHIKGVSVGPGVLQDNVGSLFKALPGFTGAAMIKANWEATANDWWHWGGIEDIQLHCNDIAAAGIAIYQMGEECVLRRISVGHATDAGFLLTGVHAVGTLESCRANGSPYGLKLTTHPTLAGNGGSVRVFGFSGDDDRTSGHAHIYQNGSHKLYLYGVKSEGWDIGLHCAGTQTGGAAAQIVLAGFFNGLGGTSDLVKISGSARPVITLLDTTASSYTNYVNDTVTSKTLPVATLTTLPGILQWNGDVFWGMQNFIFAAESSIAARRADTGTVVTLINLLNSALETVFKDRDGNNVIRIGATRKLGLFGAAPVVQPSANADTSGATLAELETEVNELKAALRSVGLIAT